MIAYEKACNIAFDYYKQRGRNGLGEANDLGDAWLFAGGDPEEDCDGGYAVTVAKDSGKVELFILPNRENFRRLEKAVPVEIPEKYAFKN